MDPHSAADLTVDPADHPGLALGEVDLAQPLRADQALLAAAVLTGADVHVGATATLGGSPVAALLRWDQDALATSAS